MKPSTSDSYQARLQETMTMLSELLESFISRWEHEGVPSISEQLESVQQDRLFLLTELIKIDLEYRWVVYALPKSLEEYLEEFPELTESNIPCDLIYEEYFLRKKSGDSLSPADLFQRFPEREDELRCLIGIYETEYSTALTTHRFREHLNQIHPGQQLGDFELHSLLGEGSFAKVFMARQVSMQRLVALKISANWGAEPQILAQLDHPHIVRVYDVRVHPNGQLRLLYMQYLAGGTLRDVVEAVASQESSSVTGSILVETVDDQLQSRGQEPLVTTSLRDVHEKQPWFQSVALIGEQLAKALAYAHRQSVLHRDLKPANVLMTSEYLPKLADFNISFNAKLAGSLPASQFGGSLSYMSPEQLDAFNPCHSRQPDSLDERTDIYSLGILLWELLAGERPFHEVPFHENWSETLNRMCESRNTHLFHREQELKQNDAALPLIRILKKCMAFQSEQRYASCEQLSEELQLAQRPRAQEILLPLRNSRFHRIQVFAPLILVLAALIPNVLAGLFNYFYNLHEIIEPWSGSVESFWRIQEIINFIAYFGGILAILIIAWPLFRERGYYSSLRMPVKEDSSLSREEKCKEESLLPCHSLVDSPNGSDRHSIPSLSNSASRPTATTAIRQRCLLLGLILSFLFLFEWIIAGIAYPVSLYLLSGSLSLSEATHFFGSLIICGGIIFAYPFFGMTSYCLRFLYPDLQGDRLALKEDRPIYKRLSDWSKISFVSALVVPLLGIALLVSIGSTARFALSILSLGSLAGTVLIFYLYRILQGDLNALLEASEHL